ncbi:MAG: methyltransferase domain-containing protein [Candidatus Eisenbacteria bacterium]|nr:methyltransferase domain-containing protein [Candidatus Eisenbacteria bacterium]
MKRDTGWTDYILGLGELPALTELWEQELVSIIKRWIPKRDGLKVLEIGCSNGRWLRWFKQEYGAVTFGADLNPAAAGVVENFVLADGLSMPISDGTFDVVFSMGLVEHFPDPVTRQKLISEHVRLAKPGTGLVWVEHPNMNFSLRWLLIKYYFGRGLSYHHYRITDREMKRHFRNLGVEILDAHFIGWSPPTLLRILSGKVSKLAPWFPKAPPDALGRKRFEHPLTADDFLIIGRRARGV